MWRNVEWRKHSYFTLSNWPGGVYGTPTLIGTRVGAISVGAWSVLLSIGRKGYVKSAKRILGAANYIRTEVSVMTDIHVLGNPQAMITSFGSNTLNIYLIFDAMKSRGWKLIACQNPASFHICLTDCNYKSAPAFVKDLSESVSEVRQGRWPESEGMAAIYGTASKVPDPAVIGELATFYLDCLYEA
jgi:sphinganine-1-phosphate aldolase